MPFYEFECERGHVTEKLVPIGTQIVICARCNEDTPENAGVADVTAYRILSPTPTTFVCAGGRKL